MAPKICVPADFGRHHIGAPSHGNLAFNMKEGDPIKANSIILSLNSPVIDNLTTNLHLTSLDADDFSREAVDCFIEATYTGEIEAVTLENFRDVNKMSHVFNVSWLSDRCVGYFDDYLEKLDTESSYTDLVFAVDEAVYQLSSIKKRVFLDLVVRKFGHLSVLKLECFFEEYLSEFDDKTACVIDCCIAIAQSNIHIIVELFVKHLEKKELKVLDDNSRVLLKKADLSLCFLKKPELHERFFSVLDQITTVDQDDLKLILSSMKQANVPRKETVSVTVPVFLISFKPYLTFNIDETVDSLINNRCITNLYMLFDAVWLWYLENRYSKDRDKLIGKIVSKRKQENWKRMNFQYLNTIFDFWGDNKISRLVLDCEQLVSNDNTTSKMIVICEYTCKQFVKEVFCKNNFFRFKLPNTSPADQEFGLIISSSGDGNPDLFNIQWRHLLDKPAGTKVTPLPTLHFALQILCNGEWDLHPISWCGKPTCDKTIKFWNWGYVKFHNKPAIKEDNMILGSDGYVKWKYTETVCGNTRVRLVCLQVD